MRSVAMVTIIDFFDPCDRSTYFKENLPFCLLLQLYKFKIFFSPFLCNQAMCSWLLFILLKTIGIVPALFGGVFRGKTRKAGNKR